MGPCVPSEVRTGEIQDTPLPFCASLSSFCPNSMLSFPLPTSQGCCCPPCLHTLHPSLATTSFHLQQIPLTGGDCNNSTQAHLPAEEDSTPWFVRGELLLFSNRHQAKWKEIRIDFSPYLSADCPALQSLILPETFHQWLIRVWEFVTKCFVITTISCYSISSVCD